MTQPSRLIKLENALKEILSKCGAVCTDADCIHLGDEIEKIAKQALRGDRPEKNQEPRATKGVSP